MFILSILHSSSHTASCPPFLQVVSDRQLLQSSGIFVFKIISLLILVYIRENSAVLSLFAFPQVILFRSYFPSLRYCT